MHIIRVGIVDEHEIFRRGIVACLQEDSLVKIVAAASHGPLREELDVAVVSPSAARLRVYSPLIMCGSQADALVAHKDNQIAAVLPRSKLRAEQLLASVRAAAVGLHIDQDSAAPTTGTFDGRRIEILRLLAEGASTSQISTTLRFSERTIKQVIYDIEETFGARTRAQAVAEGMRRGLI